MKKIDELTLENFKFFRGLETLKFNSKNILVYGENGSGKSSLYWALYTFMQSSLKEIMRLKNILTISIQKGLLIYLKKMMINHQ